MGMSVGGGRSGPKSDINVTPLVDVVLVLLIIFMVLTPMMQGQEVKLPAAERPEDKPPQEPLILALTAERKLYVGADAYPDTTRFQARLQDELRREPGRKLLLKADQGLACGDVREVLRLARTAGVNNVSLGVEAPQD